MSKVYSRLTTDYYVETPFCGVFFCYSSFRVMVGISKMEFIFAFPSHSLAIFPPFHINCSFVDHFAEKIDIFRHCFLYLSPPSTCMKFDFRCCSCRLKPKGKRLYKTWNDQWTGTIATHFNMKNSVDAWDELLFYRHKHIGQTYSTYGFM